MATPGGVDILVGEAAFKATYSDHYVEKEHNPAENQGVEHPAAEWKIHHVHDVQNVQEDAVLALVKHAAPRKASASTTDATETEAADLGAVPTNGTMRVQIEILAKKGNGEIAMWRHNVLFVDTAGTVSKTILDVTDADFLTSGLSTASTDVRVDAGSIKVFVTGEGGTSLTWRSRARVWSEDFS